MAEKEYTEREALVERLKKEECDCEWLWAILDIPAADVVEVVRCKDCKYRKTEDCAMFYECNCGEQHTWETDNDFCSYGKRRADNEV